MTRVISRVTLQQKLADAVAKYGGEHVVMNNCYVTDFEEVCLGFLWILILGQHGTRSLRRAT